MYVEEVVDLGGAMHFALGIHHACNVSDSRSGMLVKGRAAKWDMIRLDFQFRPNTIKLQWGMKGWMI